MVEEDIYSALAHPKRRNILLEMFYEGESTITRFKQELNMKTATLYHHLNMLVNNGLVTQNGSKAYCLTSKGISSIQPLFANKMDEFHRINLQVHNNDSENNSSSSNEIFIFTTIPFYSFLDRIFSTLYTKLNLLTAIFIFQILLTLFSLSFINHGLIGSHLIFLDNYFLVILSVVLTLGIMLFFVYMYPKLFNRYEPLSIELIFITSLILLPVMVFSSIISLFLLTNNLGLISNELLIVMELCTQVFWITWIYLIFRRIYSLDPLKSLLGSFGINYLWLTIILIIG